jgi:hypothetical protein
MKQALRLFCLTLCVFLSAASFAQKTVSHKPSLFANYPAIIDCTQEQLSNIFNAVPGQNIKLVLANNFIIEGPVKSYSNKYTNLQTVAIQLPAFNNMLFALSKRTDATDAVVYVGHLFNKDYADGYELKRNQGNQYQFVKIETDYLLPTCSH